MSLESESAGWFQLDADWRAQMQARSAQYQRAQLAEKAARGIVRTSTPRVPFTVAALIDAIGERVEDGAGWDLLKRQQYAEHLIQPYCTCEPERGDESEGWELCPHALDEGF